MRPSMRGCLLPTGRGLRTLPLHRSLCGHPRARLLVTAAAQQQVESSQSTEAHDPSSEAPKKEYSKRMVAVHVGYVGSAYNGLQANRELPQLSTIEGCLEKAMFDAGMIKEVNFGDFRKTKWSRSSRTDKGVHSLSTVIGVKLILKEGSYEEDPEGLAHAAAINRHLARDIRTFSVQRVNKSFNSRRWCQRRTYEYYIPASLLGLDGPFLPPAAAGAAGTAAAGAAGAAPPAASIGSSYLTEADQQKLATFRRALEQYVGTRPFQNFAGNRKQYVRQQQQGQARADKRAARQARAAAAAAAAAEAPGSAGREDLEAMSSSADASTTATSSMSSVEGSPLDHHHKQQQQQQGIPSVSVSTSEAEETIDEEVDAEERAQYEAAVATTSSSSVEAAIAAIAAAAAAGRDMSKEEAAALQVFYQDLKWLDAPDPNDPLVKSHYRKIWSFTAGDPRPLVPGGVPCLKLEVTGDSFMLHQIRNMVGAAVAAARGILPGGLLEVALSAPARMAVPRAPPHTLLLADSYFSPFPAGWGLGTPLVAKYTGERLQLRQGGVANREEFRAEVFDHALNELLQHPDWALWSEQLLPRYYYPPEAVAQLRQQHAEWYQQLQQRRAAEREAAAAAAAAAAGDSKGGGNAGAGAKTGGLPGWLRWLMPWASQ